MQEQIIEQTIIINYALNLAETGLSMLAFIAAGVAMIAAACAIYYFVFRGKTARLGLRGAGRPGGFGVFVLAIGFAALAVTMPMVQAAPTLTLSTGDTLTVTIPEGGGSASAQTTITTATANATGYTLRAELGDEEPGIAISLKGGSLTEPTLLTPGAVHTLSTTDAANASETVDTTAVTLDFQIDSTVTPGTKTLKLVYTAVDNEPTEPPAPLTMQSMTADYCANHMTIYNGTNPDAILTLTDTRADQQTYQVAKLADNNCWMLDNLKLGSTTSTIALTHEDTNIDEGRSPFMLPQVATTGTTDYDNPGVYGPVPGDTGTGATNYGYLYNWSAATAGESRTTHTEADGDAPYSICPANWRLPTGGVDMDTWTPLPTNEFNTLNANMAGFTDNQDPDYLANYWEYQSNWQYDGPFKGVFAGYWWGSFYGQDDWGFLWSRSAYPGNANSAFSASFDSGVVYPGDDVSYRDYGFGVRCLLN